MRNESEITERRVELRAELRRLENREALGLNQSLEEIGVADALSIECDVLDWVLELVPP